MSTTPDPIRAMKILPRSNRHAQCSGNPDGSRRGNTGYAQSIFENNSRPQKPNPADNSRSNPVGIGIATQSHGYLGEDGGAQTDHDHRTKSGSFTPVLPFESDGGANAK